MDEDFDPKLKEALAKVKAIASEYECAYFCVLSNKTHYDCKMDFPEWSLVQYNGGGIKVKASEDLELANSSLGLLYSIRDATDKTFAILQKITEEIEKKMKIEHQVSNYPDLEEIQGVNN